MTQRSMSPVFDQDTLDGNVDDNVEYSLGPTGASALGRGTDVVPTTGHAGAMLDTGLEALSRCND